MKQLCVGNITDTSHFMLHKEKYEQFCLGEAERGLVTSNATLRWNINKSLIRLLVQKMTCASLLSDAKLLSVLSHTVGCYLSSAEVLDGVLVGPLLETVMHEPAHSLRPCGPACCCEQN